jgi:hypothetical protein
MGCKAPEDEPPSYMFVDSHVHKRNYTRILPSFCFVERVQTIQRHIFLWVSDGLRIRFTPITPLMPKQQKPTLS